LENLDLVMAGASMDHTWNANGLGGHFSLKMMQLHGLFSNRDRLLDLSAASEANFPRNSSLSTWVELIARRSAQISGFWHLSLEGSDENRNIATRSQKAFGPHPRRWRCTQIETQSNGSMSSSYSRSKL
jgi:hypothetical protein